MNADLPGVPRASRACLRSDGQALLRTGIFVGNAIALRCGGPWDTIAAARMWRRKRHIMARDSSASGLAESGSRLGDAALIQSP